MPVVSKYCSLTVSEHRQVEFSWRRRRPPFDPHAPRNRRRPHRRLHRHGRAADTRRRRQPLEHLVVESDARRRIAVLRAWQADVDRDEIARIEPRIERRETHEAGEKQSRATSSTCAIASSPDTSSNCERRLPAAGVLRTLA